MFSGHVKKHIFTKQIKCDFFLLMSRFLHCSTCRLQEIHGISCFGCATVKVSRYIAIIINLCHLTFKTQCNRTPHSVFFAMNFSLGICVPRELLWLFIVQHGCFLHLQCGCSWLSRSPFILLALHTRLLFLSWTPTQGTMISKCLRARVHFLTFTFFTCLCTFHGVAATPL